MTIAQTIESRRHDPNYGGSTPGIRHHYDISNEFWGLMLGPSFMYSAAIFEQVDEDLNVAQQRKIDWHLHSAGVPRAKRVLDVGCGWGTILKQCSENARIERVHGLTLSQAQADHIAAMKLKNVAVFVQNWARYEPDQTYDSIISIGAFEHFAKPTESRQEKLGVYRDFFERCRRWLKPDGRMSLQTIAYGTMRREDASEFINTEIYPDSDLPFLQEIVEATDGLFEIERVRNDRHDYARSYDGWLQNLRRERERAVAMVGEEQVRRFEKFYKLGSLGFRMGKIWLLRFTLRPISTAWDVYGTDPLTLTGDLRTQTEGGLSKNSH